MIGVDDVGVSTFATIAVSLSQRSLLNHSRSRMMLMVKVPFGNRRFTLQSFKEYLMECLNFAFA